MQERVLKLLKESEGMILDNEPLINTLQQVPTTPAPAHPGQTHPARPTRASPARPHPIQPGPAPICRFRPGSFRGIGTPLRA